MSQQHQAGERGGGAGAGRHRGKETVVRQRLPSPAAGQPVEVLGVCHLEGLPQVPLALPVLRREEGLHGWVVVEGSNQEID